MGDESVAVEQVAIGVLGRPHGLHGEIFFRPFDRDAETIASAGRILVGGDQMTVTAVRRVNDGYLLKLQGVSTRDGAAKLGRREVRVPREALPPLGPGEFFIADLQGCEVLDESGRRFGPVTNTFWNGAHDVMVVTDSGPPAREHLIPVVPAHVLAVDTEAKRITVRWDPP